MRYMVAAIVAQLCLATFSTAMTISNISTGIADDGNPIPFGNPDDDWSLIAAPNGVGLGSVMVLPPSGASFLSMEPDARWVSRSTDTNYDAPWGNYTYELHIDLDLDALTNLIISGQYAADNRLIDMRLNGNTFFVGPNVSGSGCPWTGCEEFRSYAAPIAFSLSDQGVFVDGRNSLQITIENQGPTLINPTSFALLGSVNGDHSPVAAPEPASLALFAVGLAALGCQFRRRVDYVTV